VEKITTSAPKTLKSEESHRRYSKQIENNSSDTTIIITICLKIPAISHGSILYVEIKLIVN
jgi:hypothetical protein